MRSVRLFKSKDGEWISYSKWISEDHFYNARKSLDNTEQARIKMAQAIIRAYDPIVMIPVIDHLMATETTHINQLS
ncbi:hypothetical protein [Psychromonas sp. MME1]|uniref:hypothetical protein n=1 Tax=Psychromonas sp. MME1 TaxID=3231032 RepID=UPI0034E24640